MSQDFIPYKELKNLNLPEISKEIQNFWNEADTFKKSVEIREGKTPFVFYEGPPSANGVPGIHHVMARAIKDIFCRYKTQKGFQVKRKAGWDTHGLPVELGVEKALGITKEDIGKKITVEEYNQACRKDVMKYTDLWNKVTMDMGYWVDMDNPYITYQNTYIESVWWLLKQIYSKGLLYKGYTIQPYSPAAGTGLSSHELNQPGTYKDVKDTTVVAQFKVTNDFAYLERKLLGLVGRNPLNSDFEQFNEKLDFLKQLISSKIDVFLLAWTTTPWTLPSNTALALGKNIDYNVVRTKNQYTGIEIIVILADALMNKYFSPEGLNADFEAYKINGKVLPYQILNSFKGLDLEGIRYEQLLPYAIPTNGEAFRTIIGDFVTTEDGTGIVHIAPSFGGDDFRVAKQNGIGSLTLVDKQGRFTEDVFDFQGEYVKEAYLNEEEKELEKQKQGRDKYLSVDERISIKLKTENKAFKVEKYEHTYPHCWRTDKPILYYPLDSWFIKTTDVKQRMVELNNQIQWKPTSTGTGRFGNWLENGVDWNLSRSRFWGIPLPIWRTDDEEEEIIIGSIEELKSEIEKSVEAGLMIENPLKDFEVGNFSEQNYQLFDLHKPYIDKVILISKSGKAMYRESDLIDVWFDSGAMPYAQLHYPFENKDLIDDNKAFPADFIAEGVDQTRGWFYTLHAISTLVFDNIAYKNVISNGLVLDKDGNKMSKRLGNAVDPFITLDKYGPDATRWYMITNASPWDNLKFNEKGIEEVQRKFFGTLHNTYNFFVLYANIDGFSAEEVQIEFNLRPELDRWILSELNSLISEVDISYQEYEPTRAGRAIEYFLDEHLSNWYVRLSRRRFWKGEMSEDKLSAYQTLFQCLETLSKLIAPISPFYSEQLYRNLNSNRNGDGKDVSVHLSDFPVPMISQVDKLLEERMEMGQKFSSMVLSLRKKSKLRVRQPLQKIMIAVLNPEMKDQIEQVKDIILSETNVKDLEYINDDSPLLLKTIKPDFKKLGPRYGKIMKQVQARVLEMSKEEISEIEKNGQITFELEGQDVNITMEEVEIHTQDIDGMLVASEGKFTVALDMILTPELEQEGLARELVNRIQNLRKSKDFLVTDKIEIKLEIAPQYHVTIQNFREYICSEVLANSLELMSELMDPELLDLEGIEANIEINKINK